MDKKTGEIRQIPDGEKPRESETPIDRMPKGNCRKCHGRGYVGWLPNGEVLPCKCVMKRW